MAKKKKEAMMKAEECKNGCPMIFSIHLWDDRGIDKKFPDVLFNDGGKADLQNWDRHSRPPDGKGNLYVNFDFGFYNESKGNIIHANHYHNPDLNGDGEGDYYPSKPIMKATIYFSSMNEWKQSYADFNSEVWCVQCSQRGDQYGR